MAKWALNGAPSRRVKRPFPQHFRQYRPHARPFWRAQMKLLRAAVCLVFSDFFLDRRPEIYYIAHTLRNHHCTSFSIGYPVLPSYFLTLWTLLNGPAHVCTVRNLQLEKILWLAEQ